jgi:hypothetical protein
MSNVIVGIGEGSRISLKGSGLCNKVELRIRLKGPNNT